MAQAAISPSSIHRTRIRSPSPSHAYNSASASPPPGVRTRQSARLVKTATKRRSSQSKENEPVISTSGPSRELGSGLGLDSMETLISSPKLKTRANGRAPSEEKDMLNGGSRIWRDSSIESDDTATGAGPSSTIRARRGQAGVSASGPSLKRQTSQQSYNGLPTLPTIGDDDDTSAFLPSEPSSPTSPGRAPPPAPSAQAASDPKYGQLAGSGVRRRRASSIKRKLSPGVTPTKAVDWEIPRKVFHSSIGFVTLALWFYDPVSLVPLITTLSVGLAAVLTLDFFRLKYPTFAEVWESQFGFLMRESERDKINGVVWYLVGVIFVLSLYPRDVAVVSILTLSWSDTTASTIGRLWGKYTPPLPAHLPLVPAIRFAPRKSLAGFLAATVTGFLICVAFWARGSNGAWSILNGSTIGLLISSIVIGVGGAVAEALDLGLDDNLTLPILSGALMWIWLSITNLLLR